MLSMHMTNQLQKKTSTAIVFALFLGGFGAHHFYLRKYMIGTLYLLFFWTYIPIFIGWIEIFFLSKRVQRFNQSLYESPQTQQSRTSTQRVRPQLKPNNSNVSSEIHHGYELPDGGFHLRPQSIKREGDRFDVTFSTNHDRFFDASVKNRNRREKYASYEPFMTYWPTFESLSRGQEKWYFYWRDQVLKGNYLDTDLSYIFLFTYELMNYGFEPNPNRSVAMLIKLYESYRDRYHKLDSYLPNWIADLMVEGGREDLAAEWYSKATVRSTSNSGQYDVFEQYNSRESFSKIPFRLWKRQFIYYRSNQFNEEHAAILSKSYKAALEVINQY
jgi:TM2 domain-containing membrane protein YozV